MKQNAVYLAYLIAIAAAEVVTVIIEPVWGIFCHIAILAAFIVHSALINERPHQELLLSLALAPLIRIISLSMPLANIPQIWWFPIVYAPLLVAALVVVRIFSIKARDIGLNFAYLWVQPLIALSGFAIGVAEYFILRPEPLITELTWRAAWPPTLILLLSTGFVEELIFRGVLQYAALKVFGWWGIVYVSFIFAILHLGFLSWIDVIFVFVVALFFSWVVKKTGSLFGVTLAHGIANTLLYVIVPFF